MFHTPESKHTASSSLCIIYQETSDVVDQYDAGGGGVQIFLEYVVTKDRELKATRVDYFFSRSESLFWSSFILEVENNAFASSPGVSQILRPC